MGAPGQPSWSWFLSAYSDLQKLTLALWFCGSIFSLDVPLAQLLAKVVQSVQEAAGLQPEDRAACAAAAASELLSWV